MPEGKDLGNGRLALSEVEGNKRVYKQKPPRKRRLCYDAQMQKSKGIHHITAITAGPQKNLDFYEGFLGQRLVKKTINFDDPSAYHLYYGDFAGTPGTILTFFYWPGVPAGTRGTGEVSGFSYAIRPDSLGFWNERATKFGIDAEEAASPFGEPVLRLRDPDAMRVDLVVATGEKSIEPWVGGPIPTAHELQGFYGAGITLQEHAELHSALTDGLGFQRADAIGSTVRYRATQQPGMYICTEEKQDLPPARQGAGSVHHIAFQVADDAEREALRVQVNDLGIASTGMIDRQYFHSTYFRTPAGVLFEIATDDIGFTIDEPKAELGEHLKLPPQYKDHREQIEQLLVPLALPRHNNGK